MQLATKGNIQVLLDLAFVEEKNWTGGKARSMQLLELFEKNGFRITDVPAPDRKGSVQILLLALLGTVQYGIFKPFCVMGLRTLGYQMFFAKWVATTFPQVRAVVIEGTGFGRVQLVPMLQKAGKKVVLIPANIESLAPYPGAWTHQLPVIKRLGVEAKYYAMANAVFCISIEETWLLQILGANACFLPYFPSTSIVEKIALRKERRKNAIKEGYLYFADFRNSPNVEGFKTFVAEKKYLGKHIKVAGLGASIVEPIIKNNSSFEYLGELSSAMLEDQLVACEKVILHHFPTSGMLTRVTELLLSNIPIEGNFAALKGYSFIGDCADEKIADTILTNVAIANKALQTIVANEA